MKSKILSLLLSFAIAFGLWLYVVTVVSPESETSISNVPVIMDGESLLEDRNLMILSSSDLRVDLKLSGNRMDLSKLNASNITVLADLSSITQPGTHNVKYSVFYPSSVQYGTIEVMEQEPQTVTVVVTERSKKEIPVKLDWTGSVPDGYEADTQNAVLDHTTISISGPRDVIDQIDYARITVDLTGKTANIVEALSYMLCGEDDQPIADVSMVSASVSQIRATVKVHAIREIPIRIEVINGGGITSEMATVTPSQSSIILSGSVSALDQLGGEIVLGPVELGKLEKDTVLTFPIVLPEGVHVISGETTVTVEVDMPEMGTRTFTVTKFRTENVPEGKYIEIKNALLSVRVRGPLETLINMSVDSIVIIVDCEGVSLPDSGNITLKAYVRIEGVEGVGAIGSYEVSVYIGDLQEDIPEG